MKKLTIESQLPVSAADAWAVFEGEAFRSRLSEETGMTAELQSETVEDGIHIRVLTFTSGRDLPGFAARALGGKRLTYNQTNRYNPDESSLQWSVDLPALGDRIRVEGLTTITDNDQGSLRLVDGEIEVRMRLIGGQVEKVVVNEFEKSMRKAVDLAISLM